MRNPSMLNTKNSITNISIKKNHISSKTIKRSMSNPTAGRWTTPINHIKRAITVIIHPIMSNFTIKTTTTTKTISPTSLNQILLENSLYLMKKCWCISAAFTILTITASFNHSAQSYTHSPSTRLCLTKLGGWPCTRLHNSTSISIPEWPHATIRDKWSSSSKPPTTFPSSSIKIKPYSFKTFPFTEINPPILATVLPMSYSLTRTTILHSTIYHSTA